MKDYIFLLFFWVIREFLYSKHDIIYLQQSSSLFSEGIPPDESHTLHTQALKENMKAPLLFDKDEHVSLGHLKMWLV